MDNNKTRVKPSSLKTERREEDGEKTRVAERGAGQSPTARARTRSRSDEDPRASSAATVTVGRDPQNDQTVATGDVNGLTKTQPSGIGQQRTEVADSRTPQKVIRRDSTFSHLEQRIEREFKDKVVLKRRFVLDKTLGAGGMGNVYLARDLLREEMEDSHSYVAIKVLNDNCRNLPGALQSLQREAKKAQALSHPNIVTVYDFDRDGETAFITMEYIHGDALKDILRKKGRMPYLEAMYVIERVARGLAYAHQQGFAHADIKPANIFLGENRVVKILDFGIAKAFTEATKEKRSLADDLTEGALTPTYASFEMLRGHQAMPSDDVYSLACMAYEMISGRHPFIGDDGLPMPADVAKEKGAKVEPIPVLSRRHMRALRKGLAFERPNRFDNAGEFIDAIKARNRKKEAMLLTSAAVVSGAIYFAISQGLEQVVPSVDSLKPELEKVAEAIIEGDELLAAGDIDFAHRLYSQAWEVASDLTANDVEEREKAHMILQDRRKKVSDMLIDKLQDESLDEYQLRELYVALEFLLKDDIGGNEKRIQKALKKIDRKLKGK